MASQHRLNQLLFNAEQHLRQLEIGERTIVRPPVETPSEIADVAEAIQSMREMAGVGR
jgi:hypothetical protein